jgi:ABC-2 type transport system permease protein
VLDFAARTEFMSRAPGLPQMNLHYMVFVPHISYVNLIFIFAIPALTMRLVAEEKKLRTYDLLLTAPISATEIALGKFLAGFGTAMALVAVAFLYPLITAFFADFPWGPLLTSFLGLAFVAGAYVAVGLFASSLTESIMLSVVMALIFNLILWFISQGVSFSDNPTFTAIMEHLSVGQHFLAFLKGSFEVSAIVFFLSCATLFVFLSQRVIESSRWR